MRKAPLDSYRIVRFDELVEDPERIIQQIYQHFKIPIRPAYARKLRRETRRAKRSRRKSPYSLEDMGLTRKRVSNEFSAIINRFWFSEAGKQRRRIRKLSRKKQVPRTFFKRRRRVGRPVVTANRRVVRRNLKRRVAQNTSPI